mgnify:CR=1 FL=1
MIEFKKVIQDSTYLNPFDGFLPYEGKIEIRWDPLTHLTSRIVHLPTLRTYGRFDYRDVIEKSLNEKCPFCPQNIDSMTCRFDKDFYGFERIERDGVTIIPNLLTFDKYCLVAVICAEHFVDMNMMSKNNYIYNSLTLLLDVLRIIKNKDSSAKYFSISCNYMPMSGSSILHPHIQAIVGEHPTNYHGMTLRESEKFYTVNHGKVFWDVLMDEEIEKNERFIGRTGDTYWYAPFAPKGNIDIGCIFQRNSFFDLDDKDLLDFNDGFKKTMRYLDRENVPGFNLAIFSGIYGEKHYRVNMRLIARRYLPPLNAADSNYFDKLHMENACLLFPEDVSSKMRGLWQR